MEKIGSDYTGKLRQNDLIAFLAVLIDLESLIDLGALFHSLVALPMNVFRVFGSINFPVVTPLDSLPLHAGFNFPIFRG